MEPFGDFFPGNPQTLDELLEQFAAQMAAVQAALDSHVPGAAGPAPGTGRVAVRGPRPPLAGGPAGARTSSRPCPGPAGDGATSFSGSDPMGLADAAASARRLGEMDQLEQFLRSATSPGALAEVDLDEVAKYLGDDGARSLDSLARLAKQLEEAGLIEQREGRYELTALGIRRIGQQALSDLFSKLAKDRLGGHPQHLRGHGSRARGPDQALRVRRPLHPRHPADGAQRRATRSGPAPRCSSRPEDFEISRTEHLTRTSTVLMVDLSLSMPMRDNFLAAKKVAIALHTLISTQFPRDFLGLVGFSEVAREIKPEDLPEVSWDFVYGTNMQHGLLLARRMLAHRAGDQADHHDHRR